MATEAKSFTADPMTGSESISPPDPEKEPQQETEVKHEVFSVFTVNQKRTIVAVGSLASFFSPLSSSIYFPALDTIAAALNVSTAKVDLTVTTYLVSH